MVSFIAASVTSFLHRQDNRLSRRRLSIMLRLQLAFLGRPDMGSPSCCRGRSREFIKAYFCLKTHRFLPLSVLGNRSKTLRLPIICKLADLPTASRLRSEGTSPKSHRLNLNSFHDRICTFFRFRMDMNHYVLSSSASLLFPEP